MIIVPFLKLIIIIMKIYDNNNHNSIDQTVETLLCRLMCGKKGECVTVCVILQLNVKCNLAQKLKNKTA